MEIYRDNCRNLPQQVEKNKHDIQTLYGLIDVTKWNKKEIILLPNNWEDIEPRKYEYNIIDDTYVDNMLYIVTASEITSAEGICDIYYTESYDGGVKLFSRYKPTVDMNVVIYYNYNVQQ